MNQPARDEVELSEKLEEIRERTAKAWEGYDGGRGESPYCLSDHLDDIDHLLTRLSQAEAKNGEYWSLVQNALKQVALCGERIAELTAQVESITEREAAVCPEDVPFDEYIKSLQKRVESLRRETWQPIETAPVDTWIRIMDKESGWVGTGIRKSYTDADNHTESHCQVLHYNGEVLVNAFYATHWMSLEAAATEGK